MWHFDFQNLFKQFTFTRNFQKSRFSTRFEPFLCLFGQDLVANAHWSFVRNEILFLKIMFCRLISVHVAQLRWLKQWPLWTSEQPLFNVFKNVWNFDFQNLFMQFTFTRKFQKSRFSTRFDSLLSPFELDLVTKAHWFPLNKKKSFLKTKFPCLISVCITWTDWLKTQLFWTRQQSGFGVFEKYFVFTFW